MHSLSSVRSFLISLFFDLAFLSLCLETSDYLLFLIAHIPRYILIFLLTSLLPSSTSRKLHRFLGFAIEELHNHLPIRISLDKICLLVVDQNDIANSKG